MPGQGDSPLSNAFFARTRYRRSQSGALIKRTASDAGAAVWDDYFFPASGPVSYTITVTGASITLNGQSVSLERGRLIGVTGSSVTLAGQSVTLRKTYPIVVTGQSIALTGQSVSLETTRLITATGRAVTLTPQSVTLRQSRLLTVSAASVSLAGQSVTLTYTPLAIVYTLTVDPASISLTGGSVTLTKEAAVAATSTRGASYLVNEKTRRKRDKEKLSRRELLEEAVKAAYLEATGQAPVSPVDEPPPPVRRLSAKSVDKLAKAIQSEVQDEITVSLSDVRDRIRALERQIIKARQEEEDNELFMFMAA